MNDVKKVKSAILDAIDTLIDKKLNNLCFDKTYIALITNKTQVSSTEYKYEVTIANNKYNIVSKTIHSIGENIKVKFPQNNPLNAYIESDSNYLTRDEFAITIKELINLINGESE